MKRGHLDIFASEVDWGQLPDGTRYAKFQTTPEDPSAPIMILSIFPPGLRIEPHSHPSNYMEYILSGGQTVGKKTYGAGDVRIVKGGTGYGPIVVSDAGCTAMIVFENASGTRMDTHPRVKPAPVE